jgi:hypothetical protein
MTFDWTADAANGWTIPLGADIGKAFNLGSHAMGLQLGAYDLLKRPDGAPQWIIRVQLTALFQPHGRRVTGEVHRWGLRGMRLGPVLKQGYRARSDRTPPSNRSAGR